MAASIILPYSSAHPMRTKKSVLYSQLLRARRVSSDPTAEKRSLARIEGLFSENGYPRRIIEQTKRQILTRSKKRELAGKKANPKETKDSQLTYVTLPFVDDSLARKVTSAVKASKLPLRIAWKSGKTLSDILTKSALDPPPCPAGKRVCNTCEAGLAGKCHTKNVVYKISCDLCASNDSNAIYIGETKRSVRERFNEHLRDAKNKTKNTPLGEHVSKKHPSDTITHTSFQITILQICKDVAELKISESIHIRNQRPNLNIMSSSWSLIPPVPYK